MDRVEVADLEPLAREVLRERDGLGVAQHAAHLGVEHAGLAEAALAGLVQQLVVGHRAPQEVAEAGGELDVGDGMDRRRIGRSAIALDVKQEVRGNQDGLESEREALLDAAAIGRWPCRRTPSAAPISASLTGRR